MICQSCQDVGNENADVKVEAAINRVRSGGAQP